MELERVIRNAPATLSMVFYSGSTAVSADGTVTVVVKKADGTTLISGDAAKILTPYVHYNYVIPSQTNLNSLTLTWSGLFSGQAVTAVSYAEVVGGFLFSIGELRNYDSTLTNATRFPDDTLVETRLSVEDEFEEVFCHRAFRPKFMRQDDVETIGDGFLWLEKPEVSAVTKLTVDGVDKLSWVTNKDITKDRTNPYVLNIGLNASGILFASTIEIEYEYGMSQVPRRIKDVALQRARGMLLGQKSVIDERATLLSIPEFGTMSLATPGQGRFFTGIPSIDVVLANYHIDAIQGQGGAF